MVKFVRWLTTPMSIENAPYVHFAYKEVMDECNGRLT